MRANLSEKLKFLAELPKKILAPVPPALKKAWETTQAFEKNKTKK